MSEIKWRHIEGWFDQRDADFYDMVARRFPSGSKFVEVGSWKGRSALCMVQNIVRYNKKIDFICVDHFAGQDDWDAMDQRVSVLNKTLYQEYLDNIAPFKNFIQTMKMSSEEASLRFEDNSIDFVYIDASHNYESVSKDLDAWSEKIKSGGIIGGHDWVAWPEVSKAVDEFAENKNLYINNEFENSWYININ